MKYEKKITKCFKSNCKPLFNNLKSKNTFRKSVNELHESDGSEPKSPLELVYKIPYRRARAWPKYAQNHDCGGSMA